MSHRSWFAVIVFALLGWQGAIAHVGGHGAGALRTWHVGHHHVRGTLHSLHDGIIAIEDAKGRLHRTRRSALSRVDQAYVDRQQARITAMREPSAELPSVEPIHQPVMKMPKAPGQVSLHVPSLGVTVLLLMLATILAAVAVRHSSNVASARTRMAAALMLLILVSRAPSLEAGLSVAMAGTDPTVIDASFSSFKPRVTTRWDDKYFYVEHDGMPMDMPAMKGITAWQQQVPIPQNYRGTNAWSIPLNPVPSPSPISLDTAMHTGAVAIAVNGLPIFNPENNRGEFSYDIGELDAFGGHCGRADDYHYHIAPVHLTTRLGNATPIAWALDGYPLYGYAEPDGGAVQQLDASLGHMWNGEYHYHATKTRPYMIASMRGVVTIDKDQVVPQARATPARPFLQALQGAEITDLHQCDSNHYALKYTVNTSVYWMNYRWTGTGSYTYVTVAPNGTRTTNTYQRK